MLQNLFIGPLGTLLESVTQLQFLGNHLRRLDDVLETETERSGTVDPGRLRVAIEFKNVDFSYTPGAPPVIQNVSLSIKPGEKIALVGPSGAGKSTMARLLLGMHLPTSGTISFDGRDLRELTFKNCVTKWGSCSRKPFCSTIRCARISSLNQESIPLSRLQWAAKMACIDKVIEGLPEGYAARVGENGCLLSGGERQRLNLARALASDPAVLLLDEATSSLDLATEAKLHANLATLGSPGHYRPPNRNGKTWTVFWCWTKGASFNRGPLTNWKLKRGFSVPLHKAIGRSWSGRRPMADNGLPLQGIHPGRGPLAPSAAQGLRGKHSGLSRRLSGRRLGPFDDRSPGSAQRPGAGGDRTDARPAIS